MRVDSSIFRGCIPALMTPCTAAREPDYEALVSTAVSLIEAGMQAVVYCGSMGDWPLLTDAQRQEGVRRLVEAGVPVIVGTGSQNSKMAAAHAAHAREIGAKGLMLIPRVLSRGASEAAQRAHFALILQAGGNLPAIIYNSPHYAFETRADLFFDLRRQFPSLVGFKEFGGAEALSYAAEHITHKEGGLALLAGVDTQVFHGFVHCGAVGAITGIGNVLPQEILRLVRLCERAAAGDAKARRHAWELNQALSVLASFDAGPDLVLYYKHLMVERGYKVFQRHFNETDKLGPSQKAFASAQLRLFEKWWADWPGKVDV